MAERLVIATALVALAVLGGCRDTSTKPPPPPAPPAAPAVFTDVTAQSGIDFIHRNGAAGEFLLPEIMAGGGGFLDFDGDGRLDIYLVQSAEEGNRLYRHAGGDRFVDVTETAGVGDRGYGMGCAAGDFDNDGAVDLYVTNVGANVLYRNRGDGTFENVTAAAGVGDEGWSTSAAFVDYDLDGDLDLFVTNYVAWSDAPVFTKKVCYAFTGARDYCSPQAYNAPSFDTLYRNDGGGAFTDVSAEAGLHAKPGTGLGVVCTDLDLDGDVDIYVSNDQMPSFAWYNDGAGRFTEEAAVRGVAVDEKGKSQAGMGVDAADIDGDGDFDIWKVHLHRESHILYINHGRYFDDATARWGLTAPTRRYTGFGTALVDYDLDGLLDTFVANGRVQFVADETESDDRYAEPNQLLRQVRPGWFEDVTASAGPALELVENSRGAAFGDYDNDGDADVLVINCNGPARLLRNDEVRKGGFVTLRVVDVNGRDAYGASVTCTIGDRTRVFEVRAASGYCTTNDPRLHIGLAEASQIDSVRVVWPDGTSGAFGPFERGTSTTIAAESPREEFEAIGRRLRDGGNQYLGHEQIDTLRAQVAAPGLDPRRRVQGLVILAMELARIGEVDEAIEVVETAVEEMQVDPRLARGVHRMRGIIYLRKAEIENCVRRHHRDCCIFPLAGGGVHTVQDPGRESLESYLFCVDASPDDLKLRWLANLAAMTIGAYPDALPPRHRIDPAVFASEYDLGRFVDVAPKLGVDVFNLCGGSIVEDFDGDDRLDIITSTYDPLGPLTFFRNRGDGTFEDRSAGSRVDRQLGGLNCIAADADNDGDADVLVLRGAWLFDDGQIRNSLLVNDGHGRFADLTRAAGLAEPAEPAMPTQAAVWGDFDLDGDLDLYVGNESRLETRNPPGGLYGSQLFRNDGDLTFTDVAGEAGVINDRYCKGVTAGDYDNDGDLDLYVSNVGANRLYRNDGDGTFTDVAPELGLTEPSGRSFACWFFDYDNDGHLDLFVAGYDARVHDVAADHLGEPWMASPPCLYRNNGDGTFTDVAADVGLKHAWLPMGANFGDLDNDGWLDIYLATGDPDYQTLMPNVALRNAGGTRFQNVTTSTGLGHLQKGHGVAFGDLDHDGDQDIYHQLGGFYPGDGFANALFLNPGHGNRFLVIDLVGTETNREGRGARITVSVETPAGARKIHRAPGSVSSFGGSPSRQEIGLGDATAITSVEIWWPRSDTRQLLEDVPLDAMIRVTEGADGFSRRPYHRIPIEP